MKQFREDLKVLMPVLIKVWGLRVAETRPSILVLEDSTTQAKIIKQMFEDEGASVETVTSAREFTSSPHLFDIKVNAVVIDVHFGEVNGLDLIDPVLRRWPGVTLVMMTANDTDDYAVLAKARAMGAHLVLRKPFNRTNVVAVMADIQAIAKTGSPRKHVVVIDDSKTTCRIAAEVLRSYGFRVSSFQAGLEAIRQLNFDKVDVVLTDINMPEMSGTEIICLVRDVWADVGIIGMSADEKAGRKCANADAFLLKPFGPEELVNKVRSVMDLEIEHLDC